MPPRLRSPMTLALGLTLALAATGARAQSQPAPLPPGTPPTPGPPTESYPPSSASTVPPAMPSPTTPPPLPPPMQGTVSGDVPPPTQPAAAPAPNAPVPNPGQVPEALIPDIRKRSGLIARFIPIVPYLPPDPRRDQWYDTRWGDPPNLRKYTNWYTNGGLYGLPWKNDCTASFYPSFFGAPGQNTLRPDCKPCHNVFRLLRSVPTLGGHPFKPVGMYYDQGTYVPVYDLDPVVPGPGAWPWPFFRRLTSAGG